MGGVLGRGRSLVLESLERFGDIVGHGEIDGSGGVVPGEGKSKVQVATPIGGDLVLGGEHGMKMLDVFAADVLHAEIVDNEAERDGTVQMGEETGSVLGLDVSVGGEMDDESVVGEFSCLWETVHPTADFDADTTVADKGRKLVIVKDIGGDVFNVNPHVFVVLHWGAEVEVFNVDRHEFGVFGGEDAVEDDFCGGEGGGFGADGARIGDSIAADGESDTTRLGFLGTVSDDEAEVGWDATRRNCTWCNEENGVGAGGGGDVSRRKTLCKTGNFLDIAAFPEGTIGTVEQSLVLDEFASV